MQPETDICHDASCIHCGGRTVATDNVCLACRGRDPRSHGQRHTYGATPRQDDRPTIDQLLNSRRKLEDIIEAQPHRKRQLADQIANLQRQIDEAQGQALLF